MRPRLKEALPNLVSLCDCCHRLMHHEPDTTGWGASRCGLCLADDSSLWSRPAESTNLHNAERTRAFATEYADRPLRSIDSLVVAEWLKGGKNRGTVDALRAMFNDARRPQAGMLLDVNPFGGLGLKRTKGRKHVQPPDPSAIARLIAAADELTPPSFAAYLVAAIWSAGAPRRARRAHARRPGLHARSRGDPHRASVEHQGAEDHDPEARLATHDRDGRPAARTTAVAAARERVGLHDAARDALHPELAQLPRRCRARPRRARGSTTATPTRRSRASARAMRSAR
jgi:hypothetical protein